MTEILQANHPHASNLSKQAKQAFNSIQTTQHYLVKHVGYLSSQSFQATVCIDRVPSLA